jgi:hypothetical protein
MSFSYAFPYFTCELLGVVSNFFVLIYLPLLNCVRIDNYSDIVIISSKSTIMHLSPLLLQNQEEAIFYWNA